LDSRLLLPEPLSGIFIPIGNQTPAWIIWLARIFPVKHFADGIQAGFLGTSLGCW